MPVLGGLAAALTMAAGMSGVFVLGVDGLDPVILERMMAQGKLEHLHRLAREGSFQPLATVAPPQSPVAWSSFVTGRDPGGHGIYDFVHRDPRSYAPISSATRLDPDARPPRMLRLGDYQLPLGGDAAENNRSGTPFWDVLHEHGVDVEVYRVPANFPPTESEARTLSGMGTVDLRGDFGTYTWYTNDARLADSAVKADVERVTLEDVDGDGIPDPIHARLIGPPSLRAPAEGSSTPPPVARSFTIQVDPDEDVVWIRIDGEEAILRVGEWSDWLDVSFELLPWGLVSVDGIVRFHLKSVRPTFQLYASPVNLSPSRPAQPITTPDEWSAELADRLGPFFTQGLPEEVNALKDGLLDDDEYIEQVALVHEESERMLDIALDHFEAGDTTFFYLSEVDLQCHMLWRHSDPKHPAAAPHPAADPELSARFATAIETYYKRVDRLLGTVRERLPEDTLLIVMSDHGFESYRRQVHVNDWLLREGFLVLREGRERGRTASSCAEAPDPDACWADTDVDWSKTRAYGLGFNGIYLNLAGREAKGIVKPEEADAVAASIATRLEALRDPANGARVVRRVDRAREVYSGERIAEAPDLVVGFDAGYGCSDDSTLGEIVGGESVIVDNTSRWSGNHLMAPEVVPGTLLVNRRLDRSGHGLADLTATLLDAYSVEPIEGMVGSSILP